MTTKKHSKFWMVLADHLSIEPMWILLVLVFSRQVSSNIVWVDSRLILINNSFQWRKKLRSRLEDPRLLLFLIIIWIRIAAFWAIIPNFINMVAKKMALEQMDFRLTQSLPFLVRTFWSNKCLRHQDSIRSSSIPLQPPLVRKITSHFFLRNTTISTTRIWIS